MKIVTFIGTSLYIVVAACAMQKDNKAPITPLYETKWSLINIYINNETQPVSTKAFIRFNKEKNSAGGNGSCNSFGSTAMVQGTNVNFKGIFSTKMYCEEVQKTEDAYLKQLAKVSRYEIKKDTLFLYENDILVLEFRAEEVKPPGT